MSQAYLRFVARRSMPFCSLILLIGVVTIFAQPPTSSPKPADGISQPGPSTPDKKRVAAAKIRRWLEIDALTVSTRYRFIESRSHATIANQDQYQVVARGRFKFD